MQMQVWDVLHNRASHNTGRERAAAPGTQGDDYLLATTSEEREKLQEEARVPDGTFHLQG